LLASEVTSIIDAYQGGSTVGQVAEQFEIDRETVRRILNQAGLVRRRDGAPLGGVATAGDGQPVA